MALVTVQRSPSPSDTSDRSLSDEEDGLSPARQKRKKSSIRKLRKLLHSVNFISKIRKRRFSESYLAVKGTALALAQTECRRRVNTKLSPTDGISSHLQSMFYLLRPQDTIKVAVKIESLLCDRHRYMVVVSCNVSQRHDEACAILGIDCNGSATIGLVLPIYSDTCIELTGDGGFYILSHGHKHMFKPISVQAMWSGLQCLYKVAGIAEKNRYLPNSQSHRWVEFYESRTSSQRSYIKEWFSSGETGSVVSTSICKNPDDPAEDLQLIIKTVLRDIMMSVDLEEVTGKFVRTSLETKLARDLTEYKSYIDGQILYIYGQMDASSNILPGLFLGSEWNASNLEELKSNKVTHILNISQEIDNFFPGMFKYMNVRELDVETTDLLKYWEKTFTFIHEARQSGKNILVHCKMGVSRSAATVLAYVMKEKEWSLEETFNHVKTQRNCIKPLPAFIEQLKIYQGMITASRQRYNTLFKSKSENNLQEKNIVIHDKENADTNVEIASSTLALPRRKSWTSPAAMIELGDAANIGETDVDKISSADENDIVSIHINDVNDVVSTNSSNGVTGDVNDITLATMEDNVDCSTPIYTGLSVPIFAFHPISDPQTCTTIPNDMSTQESSTVLSAVYSNCSPLSTNTVPPHCIIADNVDTQQTIRESNIHDVELNILEPSKRDIGFSEQNMSYNTIQLRPDNSWIQHCGSESDTGSISNISKQDPQSSPHACITPEITVFPISPCDMMIDLSNIDCLPQEVNQRSNDTCNDRIPSASFLTETDDPTFKAKSVSDNVTEFVDNQFNNSTVPNDMYIQSVESPILSDTTKTYDGLRNMCCTKSEATEKFVLCENTYTKNHNPNGESAIDPGVVINSDEYSSELSEPGVTDVKVKILNPSATLSLAKVRPDDSWIIADSLSMPDSDKGETGNRHKVCVFDGDGKQTCHDSQKETNSRCHSDNRRQVSTMEFAINNLEPIESDASNRKGSSAAIECFNSSNQLEQTVDSPFLMTEFETDPDTLVDNVYEDSPCSDNHSDGIPITFIHLPEDSTQRNTTSMTQAIEPPDSSSDCCTDSSSSDFSLEKCISEHYIKEDIPWNPGTVRKAAVEMELSIQRTSHLSNVELESEPKPVQRSSSLKTPKSARHKRTERRKTCAPILCGLSGPLDCVSDKSLTIFCLGNEEVPLPIGHVKKQAKEFESLTTDNINSDEIELASSDIQTVDQVFYSDIDENTVNKAMKTAEIREVNIPKYTEQNEGNNIPEKIVPCIVKSIEKRKVNMKSVSDSSDRRVLESHQRTDSDSSKDHSYGSSDTDITNMNAASCNGDNFVTQLQPVFVPKDKPGGNIVGKRNSNSEFSEESQNKTSIYTVQLSPIRTSSQDFLTLSPSISDKINYDVSPTCGVKWRKSCLSQETLYLIREIGLALNKSSTLCDKSPVKQGADKLSKVRRIVKFIDQQTHHNISRRLSPNTVSSVAKRGEVALSTTGGTNISALDHNNDFVQSSSSDQQTCTKYAHQLMQLYDQTNSNPSSSNTVAPLTTTTSVINSPCTSVIPGSKSPSMTNVLPHEQTNFDGLEFIGNQLVRTLVGQFELGQSQSNSGISESPSFSLSFNDLSNITEIDESNITNVELNTSTLGNVIRKLSNSSRSPYYNLNQSVNQSGPERKIRRLHGRTHPLNKLWPHSTM